VIRSAYDLGAAELRALVAEAGEPVRANRSVGIDAACGQLRTAGRPGRAAALPPGRSP
jgi:adenine C2-methylase RlmN of 23S rRNA A2503 and tRNA A37